MNDLRWEPLSVNHAEELLTLWGDNDVIRYTAVPAPCSLEQMRGRIDSLSTFDVFMIRMEGEAVGVVGCIRMDGPGERYEVFYQLKEIFWGKGFATRAVEQLLMRMKEESSSAAFYVGVAAGNIASEKILRHSHFHCISAEEDGFERGDVKRVVRKYKL